MNTNKEYGGIAIDTETTGLDSSVDEILQGRLGRSAQRLKMA